MWCLGRMWKINVATVFTTHATMLGREVTQYMHTVHMLGRVVFTIWMCKVNGTTEFTNHYMYIGTYVICTIPIGQGGHTVHTVKCTHSGQRRNF